jgi:hypothetical protein
MRRGLAQRSDVVHPHTLRERGRGVRPLSGLQPVAEHKVDLGHGGEGGRIDLGCAAGDHQLGARTLPPRLADRLTRLTHRLARHRAGVEDHRIFQSIRPRPRQGLIAFIGVQAAAEGDDL